MVLAPIANMTTQQFNAGLTSFGTKGKYTILVGPSGVTLRWHDYLQQEKHWDAHYGNLATILALALVEIVQLESQI